VTRYLGMQYITPDDKMQEKEEYVLSNVVTQPPKKLSDYYRECKAHFHVIPTGVAE
jgi:hypothetical protein